MKRARHSLSAPPICAIGRHMVNFDQIRVVTLNNVATSASSDDAVCIQFGSDGSLWLEDEEEKALFLRQYEGYAAMRTVQLQLDAGQEVLTLVREEERRLPDGIYRFECYRSMTWLGNIVITRLGRRLPNASWIWTTRSTVVAPVADDERDDATAVTRWVERAWARWTRHIDRMAAYAALAGERVA